MKIRRLLLVILLLFPVMLSAQENGRPIPESYLKYPGKPILIMFTATWCGPCQQLKTDLFPHPDVKPILTQMNLLLMDMDTEEGRKYWKIYARPGWKGIPHMALLDKNQQVVGEWHGYNTGKNPKQRQEYIAKFVEFLNNASQP